MKQQSIPLGPGGQPVKTFECHYCGHVEGTFNPDRPADWGATRTRQLACYACFRAISRYEKEIMELPVRQPTPAAPAAIAPPAAAEPTLAEISELDAPPEPPEEPTFDESPDPTSLDEEDPEGPY